MSSTGPPFQDLLSGGDPRSLGRTPQAVEAVLGDARLLEDLFGCLGHGDEVVRMRAGDALEKVCRLRPEWFVPLIPQLLGEMAAIDQASVRWHLAQMLGEVPLDPSQREAAVRILERYLDTSGDWIVLNCAMQSLSRLAEDDPSVRPALRARLERLRDDPHRSVAGRAVGLLARLDVG